MKVLSCLLLYLVGNLDITGAQTGWIRPKSVEDYYWRDFYGLVPTDAIPGGLDENGVITYIAQFTTIAEYNSVHAPIHTVPAVVTKGSNFAIAAYGGRALASNDTTNTKILCSSYYNNRYKWYSPSASFPSNCRFVIGGFEDRLPMYIGRATLNKEKLIGKIFPDNTNHRQGLISPYKGGEVFNDVYEVLTYCY